MRTKRLSRARITTPNPTNKIAPSDEVHPGFIGNQPTMRRMPNPTQAIEIIWLMCRYQPSVASVIRTLTRRPLINVRCVELARLLLPVSVCEDHHVLRSNVSRRPPVPPAMDNARPAPNPKRIPIAIIAEPNVVNGPHVNGATRASATSAGRSAPCSRPCRQPSQRL